MGKIEEIQQRAKNMTEVEQKLFKQAFDETLAAIKQLKKGGTNPPPPGKLPPPPPGLTKPMSKKNNQNGGGNDGPDNRIENDLTEFDKSNIAAKNAEDLSDLAEDAAREAQDSAQQAQDAADAAKQSAIQGCPNGGCPKGGSPKGNGSQQSGGQSSDSSQSPQQAQDAANKAKQAADRAKQAADRAKQAADRARDAVENGNEQSAEQAEKEASDAADEAMAAANEAKQLADEAAGKQGGAGGSSSEDSEGGSGGNTGQDYDEASAEQQKAYLGGFEDGLKEGVSGESNNSNKQFVAPENYGDYEKGKSDALNQVKKSKQGGDPGKSNSNGTGDSDDNQGIIDDLNKMGITGKPDQIMDSEDIVSPEKMKEIMDNAETISNNSPGLTPDEKREMWKNKIKIAAKQKMDAAGGREDADNLAGKGICSLSGAMDIADNDIAEQIPLDVWKAYFEEAIAEQVDMIQEPTFVKKRLALPDVYQDTTYFKRDFYELEDENAISVIFLIDSSGSMWDGDTMKQILADVIHVAGSDELNLGKAQLAYWSTTLDPTMVRSWDYQEQELDDDFISLMYPGDGDLSGGTDFSAVLPKVPLLPWTKYNPKTKKWDEDTSDVAMVTESTIIIVFTDGEDYTWNSDFSSSLPDFLEENKFIICLIQSGAQLQSSMQTVTEAVRNTNTEVIGIDEDYIHKRK